MALGSAAIYRQTVSNQQYDYAADQDRQNLAWNTVSYMRETYQYANAFTKSITDVCKFAQFALGNMMNSLASERVISSANS